MKLGRGPTDEEISEATELSVRHIEEVRDAARAVTSLDRPVGEEGDTAFGDLLPNEAGPRGRGPPLPARGGAETVEELPERERL